MPEGDAAIAEAALEGNEIQATIYNHGKCNNEG